MNTSGGSKQQGKGGCWSSGELPTLVSLCGWFLEVDMHAENQEHHTSYSAKFANANVSIAAHNTENTPHPPAEKSDLPGVSTGCCCLRNL